MHEDLTLLIYLSLILETWKESVTKIFGIHRKEKQLYQLEDRGRSQELSPELKQKIKKLKQKIYSEVVESNFIFEVEREEKILKNIAKNNPDVVIVGAGHSEQFIMDRELIRKELDITFDEYAREIVTTPSDFIPLEPHHFKGYAQLVRNPPSDESILANRNSLYRKYSALKLGRILLTKKPNFIGTWDLEIPARGLFEMYITHRSDGKIEGIIEDCIGSAQFAGELSNNNVKFVKAYDKLAVKIGGAEELLFYEGELKDGEYHGNFRSQETEKKGLYQEQPRVEGKFTLKPFTQGIIVKEN